MKQIGTNWEQVKIGWELEWISTKLEDGLGFNECLDDKKG